MDNTPHLLTLHAQRHKYFRHPTTKYIYARPSIITQLDSLDICSGYLDACQSKQDKNDTKNSVVRYFVPAVGGPVPSAEKHKPVSLEEEQSLLTF
jgi:hypothetical protein